MEIEEQGFQLFTDETKETNSVESNMLNENVEHLEKQDREQIEHDDTEKTESEKEENDKTVDVVQDELELTKRKTKDNLWELNRINSKMMLKCQVKSKACIAEEKTKLEAIFEKRKNRETLLNEWKCQQDGLTKRLILEDIDCNQLEDLMSTISTFIDILTEKLKDLKYSHKTHESQYIKYKTESKDIDNKYEVLMKTSKKYNSRKKYTPQLRLDCEKKQHEYYTISKQFSNQQSNIEQNINEFRVKMETENIKNKNFVETNDTYQQDILKYKNNLTILENEITSISLNETEQLLRIQEKENTNRINVKLIEKEILTRRSVDQENIQKDLKSKLQRQQNQNVSIEQNHNLLKKEVDENKEKCEDKEKLIDDNILVCKANLQECVNQKAEVKINLRNIELDINRSRENRTNYLKELEITNKHNLNKSLSSLESLNTSEKELERDIQKCKNTHEMYINEKAALENKLADKGSRIAQLNDMKILRTQKFKDTKFSHSFKIQELTNILNVVSEENKCKIEQSVNEINEIKINLQEKTTILQNKYLELNEKKQNLNIIKGELGVTISEINDLSEEVTLKTKKRDELYQKHKQLQNEIKTLKERIENIGKDKVMNPEPLITQKPTGILKNPTFKSPQKKVTFNETLGWESESSADFLFDRFINKTGSNTVKPQTDLLSEILSRNSPPERETNTLFKI